MAARPGKRRPKPAPAPVVLACSVKEGPRVTNPTPPLTAETQSSAEGNLFVHPELREQRYDAYPSRWRKTKVRSAQEGQSDKRRKSRSEQGIPPITRDCATLSAGNPGARAKPGPLFHAHRQERCREGACQRATARIRYRRAFMWSEPCLSFVETEAASGEGRRPFGLAYCRNCRDFLLFPHRPMDSAPAVL